MRTATGAVVLIGTICWLVFHKAGVPIGFSATAANRPWGQTILLIIAMLLGIVFGRLHAGVSSIAGPVNVRDVIASGLRDGAFWASLFASPVLFGIVYSAAKGQPDLVLAGVFSFENGFFCQRILERRLQEIEGRGQLRQKAQKR